MPSACGHVGVQVSFGVVSADMAKGGHGTTMLPNLFLPLVTRGHVLMKIRNSKMGGKSGNPENAKLHRKTAGRRRGIHTVAAKTQNEVSTSIVDARNIAPP